jgi:hypothetical protein
MAQTATADQFAAVAAANPAAAKKLIADFKKTIVVPHSGGQIEVLEAKERFQVCCAGRRWGKTKIAVKKALRHCMEPDKVVWWVAPNYKNVRRGYREVLRQIPPGVLAKPAPVATSNELILQFTNGTRMEFYSAENPDSLAGEGVDYCVVDEAALISDTVWDQLLRPTLMDKHGHAFMISTPRGYNWFYRMWKSGQDQRPGYASWRFPTETNPYIPASEIEEARHSLPLAIYEQEILASFISDAASVFRGLEDATRGLVEVEPGSHVYLGIDLAKHYDFTVITGCRSSDRLPCYHDRFNAVSWVEQRRRIHDAVAKIEAQGVTTTVCMDTTGVGDVVFDDLEAEGLDVMPIKFTNQWKQQAVMLLAADLERGLAFINPRQRDEFESYTYEITTTGRFKYGGPENGHDDEVSAKLLEHWGVVHGGVPDVRLLGASEDAYSRTPFLSESGGSERPQLVQDGEWEVVDGIPETSHPLLGW